MIKNSFRNGFYLIITALLSCTSHHEIEEEIVVTGIRGSLAESADVQRSEADMVAYDISAADIGPAAKREK